MVEDGKMNADIKFPGQTSTDELISNYSASSQLSSFFY